MRRVMASVSLSILLVALLAAYSFVIGAINKDPAYSDFGKFYQSAQLFWEGKSIYQPSIVQCIDHAVSPPQNKQFFLSGNLNAPFFTVLMLPISLLNYATAITVWQTISLIAGLLSVIRLWRIFHIGPWYQPAALALLVAVLGYFPSYLNLQSAQVGLMLLLATIGVWQWSRTGRDSAAGLLLGILISVKVFYGLFLLFLLLHKRWRMLWWTLISFVLSNMLVELIFGFDIYRAYHQILQDIYWYSSSWNGSIWGFLVRLFGYHEKNIPILAIPGLATIIYYGCAGLLLFIYLKNIRKPILINQVDKYDVNFSLTLVLMLLLSPLGWAYYYPLIVIPILVLWYLQRSYPQLGILVFLSGIVLLISGIPTLLMQPWQMTTPTIILTTGSYYCYALVLLFAVLCVAKNMMKWEQHNTVLQAEKSQPLMIWLIVFYSLALLPSIIAVTGVSLNQTIHYGSYTHYTSNCEQR